MSDPISTVLDDTTDTDTLTTMAMGDVGRATEQVRVNNAAADASYAASNAAAQSVVAATRVVSSTQQQGALTAQAATQAYAHALGVDADGALSAQQNQAQATFLDASARAAESARVIAEKRSVSFFDDPLQWLTNKVTINDDIANFNGAANEANTAEQFIQETNQLIDQRAVSLNAIKTVTTQAAAEAQTNILVAQQQELAENLKRAGLASNTAGIEAISGMSWRNIQIMSAKTDADSKVVAMQNAQDHLQIAREQLDLEKARLALQNTKEQEKDGADQYMHDQLVKGLKLMYPNNPAAWDIPDGKYKAMISGKTPLDPIWKTAFDRAQASDIVGSRSLGNSPADALNTLQYKPTLSPAAQPTVDLLNRGLAVATNSPAYKQAIAAKDPKAAQDVINAAVNQLVKSDAQHVDSPTSLYYLPPLNKIAESIPGVQDSPFYKTIVAPAATAGIDMSDPGQVAKSAIQAIKEGKISLNEAANNMSAMYGIGQQWNFEAKQLFSLGITAPPSYTTNVSGLTFQGIPGKLGTVDWTNENQVKEMFMRLSAIDQQLTTRPLLSARVR